MNTRTTLLASALVAAGATALLAPPYLGAQLEQQFRASIAQHAQQGPAHWQLLRYERGLYTSHARSRIEFLSPEGETRAWELDHQILHGFGLAGVSYGTITTTLRLDGEAGAALHTLFGAAEPLTLVSRFGLDGAISGRIASPAAEGTLALRPRPVVLTWQGFEGHYRLSPDQHGTLELSAPGLIARFAEGSLTLSGMNLSAHLQKSASSGLWLGNSGLRISLARFDTPSPGLALEGIAMATEAHEAEGLVRSSLSYGVEELHLGKERVRDLRLKLTASNLDAAALKAYELATRRVAGPPTAQRATVADAFRTQLPAFLARRPQLSIDEAQLSYQGEVLRLSGALRYVGINPHDAFSPLTDLAGEARLQLPRGLLVKALQRRLEQQAGRRALPPAAGFGALAEREVDQFITRLDGAGLLLATDDELYTAVLRLQNGSLSLNGQPLGGMPGTLPQRAPVPDI